MNTQIIRKRVNEDHNPFVFRLSDGTRVRVAHPDFVAVAPGLVFVIGEDYSVAKIDPRHVVAIEKRSPRKAKSNGKRSH